MSFERTVYLSAAVYRYFSYIDCYHSGSYLLLRYMSLRSQVACATDIFVAFNTTSQAFFGSTAVVKVFLG